MTAQERATPGYSLFLVASANHAMAGEQALIDAGIPCRLIPVPRTLSSQCGVCLQVAASDRSRAEAAAAAAGVLIEGVHDAPAGEDAAGKDG